MVGPLGLHQDRIQIEVIKRGITTADLGQKVGPANHLFQRPETKRGDDFTNLFGKMGEQLHHLFRCALEFRPQIVALRTDADRAGVGVALPDHDAPHRDQCRGANPIFVSTKHRRHDNVAAGFQTTIGAQNDLVTKIIHAQHLMHFRQAHLPGQAGMLDRGLRAGTRTAAMSRDKNGVGFCLCHSGGDGADTGRGDQLDAHFRIRVDLLQIIDQLRQILDRIDVVMRWRRDQRHTRGRVAKPGNQAVNLDAGKLAALAGLCALRNLDLDFLATVQIFGGDTKPPGGDLLDRAGRVVAILAKLEACRVLSTLAGIGFRADPVHRDRQRFMRLRAQRAKRDSGRYKSLADAGDRFNILKLDRLAANLEIHQVTKIDRPLAVYQRGIFLPAFIGPVIARMLHGMDQLAIEGVPLARPAIAEKAANRQEDIGRVMSLAMHFTDAGRDAGQAKAGNPR